MFPVRTCRCTRRSRDNASSILIDHHLGLIEELERHISAFDARIGEVLAPFRDTVERLITTPGVGRGAAEVILAEIGPDMSAFPTAGHLLSWAGVVPRLDESAGKRRSTRVRTARLGSNPCSSNVPGALRVRREHICRRSSSVSRRGGRRKRPSPSRPQFSRRLHMLKDGTSQDRATSVSEMEEVKGIKEGGERRGRGGRQRALS